MHIDLKDYFPAHLFIEMCYGRKNKFGLIYEQKLPYEEFNKLCESYGVFNGCQELTEEIIENINKAIQRGIKNYMFDVKNSSFIKTIAFEIVDGTVSGMLPEDSKIRNNKYDPLMLSIGRESGHSFKSIIMHELMHAYQDYNHYMNGTRGLDKQATDSGYYKNPVENAITFNDNNKRKISFILYHLTDFERNAYISQIRGELESCEETFDNVREVYDYIKSTITYRNYQTIFKWGKEIMNEDDVQVQNIIMNYVKELSNLKFNTYNQFAKWLNNKINSYQKKFNQIVPKMAADYFNMNESFNTPLDYLIEHIVD